jgi:hypothetical protein
MQPRERGLRFGGPEQAAPRAANRIASTDSPHEASRMLWPTARDAMSSLIA